MINKKGIIDDDYSKHSNIVAGFQPLNNIQYSFILFELRESILILGVNKFALILKLLIDIPTTNPQNLTIYFSLNVFENPVDYQQLLEIFIFCKK